MMMWTIVLRPQKRTANNFQAWNNDILTLYGLRKDHKCFMVVEYFVLSWLRDVFNALSIITDEEENSLNIKRKNISLLSTLGHSVSNSPYCKYRANTQCPLEGKMESIGYDELSYE
ncbi:Hypothetical predicted protein [Octopus vulgaris]|uniref:Uncharacterized protein n=1 Tax=Octopus vulgaris TaxID=6645 RepID=A0AA36AHP5_OCTVU|nr:Hypothetical predicted protein [Octopus vulgaris]